MELSSSEMKTIQHQYDALAKKVLKGEARSYYRELSKRAALEVNFSEMTKRNSYSFTRWTSTRAITTALKCPAMMCL